MPSDRVPPVTDSAPFEEPGEDAAGSGLLYPPDFDDRRYLPSQRALLLALVTLLLIAAGTIFVVVRPDATGDAAPQPHTAAPSVAGGETSTGVPALPPAPVKPVEFLDLAPATARDLNAAVPFSTDPNPAAAALRLGLRPDDEARAVDCLAAAAWYEAGDEAVGEQAVVQVILNRLRHPAFPKSVCEVVFQGSERRTGCQFSFTCDGAMRRMPSPAAWSRARDAATAGLNGLVYAPVGYATHYHTDWVVPNWSRHVDKVAGVDTHLFFRWQGANGRPGAFRGVHRGSEPVVARMMALSPAHGPAGAAAPAIADVAPSILGNEVAGLAVPVGGGTVAAPITADPAATLRDRLVESDGTRGIHVIGIAPDGFPGSLALVALDLCKGTPRACTVVGFLGKPGRVTGDAVGRVRWPERPPDFYYFADRSRGRETVYWSCETFKRPDPAQCLPPNFVANG